MKVLLTGAGGQLGRCFQDRFPAQWQLIATTHQQLDITDQAAVTAFIKQHKPDVVLNAAAYTAVDKAESVPEIAEKINKFGPYYLALACRESAARFFHISTDYVFDGTQNRPYKESDNTNPLGIYGATKLAGEKLTLEINPNATIIRTAWVFSEYGNNFVKTMLRLAKERDELKIVNDQIGCPTYAGDIASAVISLIQADANSGIYHYCGNEVMSWYDFAMQIINTASVKEILSKKPTIIGISTLEYPTPVTRPPYSVLDCAKIQTYPVTFSSLQDVLNNILII
ncbi:dTDP-4-dehydrorhamnose reductase [Orbaceae bacterium ESL0721]|nr:dTDP-4-dehydrorhamnose reductase [Orbaceae bacterium ESL0721]